MTVRRVRLPLVLLLDVLGAYALAAVVVQVLSGGEGSGPSLAAVAAVVAGSFALARLLRETELDERTMRNAGAAVSALALFAVLHLEYAASTPPWDLGWLRTLVVHPDAYSRNDAHVFVGVIVLTLLWLRGIVRGQQTLDASAVLAGGTLGLAAVAVAAATLPAARGPDAFGAIALAYVAGLLGALALYHAPDADVPARAFAAQWSGGVAALLGGAVALTMVAAAIDPGAFGFVAPAGKPLLFVLETLARYTLGPIIGGIAWLLAAILPTPHAPPPPRLPASPLTDREQQQDTPAWLRITGYVLAGGLLAVLALALLGALWLLFRRYAKRRERAQERR